MKISGLGFPEIKKVLFTKYLTVNEALGWSVLVIHAFCFDFYISYY